MPDVQSSVEPQRAAGVYAKGALFGLTAVSIWAGWIGMHAAAIAAVASLGVYLPIYVLVCGDRLLGAPIGDIALQALVQGVLTAVVSLILYGRAVELLGASSGAAFAAICPVLTALFGIALLDEMPTQAEWATIATISSGVYLLTGGPLPRWWRVS